MSKLGTEKITWDGDHERRERLEAIAECPDCGKQVECWADTEAWTQGDDGRWHHSEYGGSVGWCECGAVIVDTLQEFLVLRPK